MNRPHQPQLSFWLLAGFSVLFILPSARLWFDAPLQLIDFEFDYFLGLFASDDEQRSATIVLIGRLIHFVGFIIIGALYVMNAEAIRKQPERYSWLFLIFFTAILWAAFIVAMPWVSPDVFAYIGSGWQDGHYGISPYDHSMSDAPDFQADEMFQNVYHGFLFRSVAYGPFFQWITKELALLSSGNEHIAIALHKSLALITLTLSCYLISRLVPSESRKWAFFFYACNPIILLSILTCAHNDQLMNVFVLLAFFAWQRKMLFLTGVALGAAFSVKYIPLLLLPIFIIGIIVQRDKKYHLKQDVMAVVMLSMGFVLTLIALYSIYPEGAKFFLRMAGLQDWLQGEGTIGSGGGVKALRNSIYFILPGVRYEQMTVVFLMAYAGFLLILLMACWKEKTVPIAEASLVVLLLFFLILNTTNQEWYLTWILTFIAIVNNKETRMFSYRLSIVFLPIVIFTVKGPFNIAAAANAVGYVLLLYLSLKLLILLGMKTRQPSSASGIL